MQKDDLDGEIDLKSCVKVSEFDVEKNYGFQIQVITTPSKCLRVSYPSLTFKLFSLLSFVLQTREATFTLSAMTAGIRRNWIEVLKKCIRPSSSPDLTQ